MLAVCIPCARQDWASVKTHDTCWLLLTSRSCTSTASTATLSPLCRCLPRCCAAGSILKTSTTDQTYHKCICLPETSLQTTENLSGNRQTGICNTQSSAQTAYAPVALTSQEVTAYAPAGLTSQTIPTTTDCLCTCCAVFTKPSHHHRLLMHLLGSLQKPFPLPQTAYAPAGLTSPALTTTTDLSLIHI